MPAVESLGPDYEAEDLARFVSALTRIKKFASREQYDAIMRDLHALAETCIAASGVA